MKISFKGMTRKALEAAVVLVLVLFVFLGILLTLNTVFPTGLKLRNLISSGKEGASYELGSRELRLNTGADEFGLGDRESVTAVLSRMNQTVKTKRHNQMAWQGAVKGMTFYDSDAVQTFTRSSATIFFKEGNFLELDENSLIVLRSMEKDVFTREHSMTVVLMDGKVTGEISKRGQENLNLEVIAPGVVAHAPSRENKDEPASFTMSVGPDNTSTLSVSGGKVDITVDGKTVEVGTNQVVKVQPGKPLVYLRPPPQPPVLATPYHGEKYLFRDMPPNVTFTWKAKPGAQEYHIALARDERFSDIVHEDTIGGSEFSHGNLKQGTYFWRVSALNDDGEGEFSRARSFELIQDTELPTLVVDYPDDDEEGNRFEVRGRTDPDARIFVGGMPVEVGENGEFVHGLFLQRGYNVIVVEAVDTVGNVNYFSKTVNVEF